jgi:hypothetical protein
MYYNLKSYKPASQPDNKPPIIPPTAKMPTEIDLNKLPIMIQHRTNLPCQFCLLFGQCCIVQLLVRDFEPFGDEFAWSVDVSNMITELEGRADSGGYHCEQKSRCETSLEFTKLFKYTV